MPKRAVFERSCREHYLHVSAGVHILLVVEQSSLESHSRGCAKTPILTVRYAVSDSHGYIHSYQEKGEFAMSSDTYLMSY